MMKPNSFLYILVLLSLWGCSLDQPEVIGVKKFKLKGFDPFQQKLTIEYSPIVRNPNSIPFWVDQVHTEIYLDNEFLGTADSDKRIDIKANSDSDFPIRQGVKVESFINQVKGLLNKDSVEIKIDGKYTFKAAKRKVVVPYVYKTYVYPKKELQNLIFSF